MVNKPEEIRPAISEGGCTGGGGRLNPETNITPENTSSQKERIVFQASISEVNSLLVSGRAFV